MLLEIISGGIVVYCSDLVVNPDSREGVCFISVAGNQTAVKGLLANLIEGNSLTIMPGGRFHQVNRLPEAYMVRIKKLPSGLAHGLAYARSALPRPADDDQTPGILLIGQDIGSVRSLFYRHLEHKTDLPLHPSWADWLWERCLERSWLYELTTLVGGLMGFAGELDPKMLEEQICAAIRQKVPEVFACFRPPY